MATTTSTERPVHVLYRCPDCRGTVRHTYRERRTVTEHSAGWAGGRWYGTSRSTVLVYSTPDGRTTNYAPPSLACPTCRVLMRARQVEGRLVAEIRCGASCRTARGPKCDCECGGEHHGEAWTVRSKG